VAPRQQGCVGRVEGTKKFEPFPGDERHIGVFDDFYPEERKMSDMKLGASRRSRWSAICGAVCGLAMAGAASAQVTVGYQMSTSGVAPHPFASVGDGYPNKILGGGALVNYTGAGNLLVNSYPFAALETTSTGWWYVNSKDHGVSDPSSITAFAAVLIDPQNQYVTREFFQQGAVAAHPTATVTLPPGWVMTGGGCLVNNPDTAPGNLLTGSYPVQQQYKGGRLGPWNQWVCASKDHDYPNPASLTAFVVGVAPVNPSVSPMPTMCVTQATSAVGPSPRVQVPAKCGPGLITGGGAIAQPIDPNAAGLLLTAMFPNYNQGPATVWEARATEHLHPSPGTVTGFAIVVDFNPTQAVGVVPPANIGNTVVLQGDPNQNFRNGPAMNPPPANGSGGTSNMPPPPPPAPANGGQCVIDINGTGYTQHEVQRWDVTGPAMMVGTQKQYPMAWSTTGAGSYTTATGSSTWTINAGANLHLSTQKLPSGTWLIQQVETQARVAGGVSGTQQTNGSTPKPIGAEAFEWMYGAISAPGTATHVDSTNTFPVDTNHKWGYGQPAGPTGTIACEWHVNP
jgi:hypothetical protein